MNPNYRVIILDDDPPARKLMEVFTTRIPDLVCVATCANAIQGIQAIQVQKPDLIFLDIQMPEMTGLELLALPILQRSEVILTTAYPEYALQSYDFSVLDYLVKPIAFDRFLKSIVKFREKKQTGLPSTFGEPPAESVPTTGLLNEPDASLISDSPTVWLREEKRLLQIPYPEIYYVEGLKDYVKVHLRDQLILTHVTIGKAEKLFPPPQFVRIHRSYIVRWSAIRLIDGNSLILTNGKELLIGPLYRDELKKHISSLG